MVSRPDRVRHGLEMPAPACRHAAKLQPEGRLGPVTFRSGGGEARGSDGTTRPRLAKQGYAVSTARKPHRGVRPELTGENQEVALLIDHGAYRFHGQAKAGPAYVRAVPTRAEFPPEAAIPTSREPLLAAASPRPRAGFGIRGSGRPELGPDPTRRERGRSCPSKRAPGPRACDRAPSLPVSVLGAGPLRD
jgi:hypothetical protein